MRGNRGRHGARAHGPWASLKAGSVRGPGTLRAQREFRTATCSPIPKPSPAYVLLCTRPPLLPPLRWKWRVGEAVSCPNFPS